LRKLHHEKLHELYCAPNVIWLTRSRTMRWAGHVARIMRKRNVYRVSDGKRKGKPLRSPRRKWEYNIKTGLKKYLEKAWTGLIWLRIRTSKSLQ